MADYYPVLKRAISSLPSKSGEMRRAVYEKARTALINQLKSYDPPLSPSEITDQRLQLEESIRRVEAEFADESFGLSAEQPPAPVAAPPPQARIPAPEPAPPRTRPPEPPITAAAMPAPEEPRSQPPPTPEPIAPAVTPETRPAASGRGAPPAAGSPSLEPRAPKAGRREIESYPPVEPAGSAGLSALQSARRDAEELGGASAQAVQSARDAIDENEGNQTRVEPGFMEGPQEGSREAPRDGSREAPRSERRPRTDRPVAARPPPKPARLDRSSRSGGRGGVLTFAIVALVLVAAGAGAVAYLRPDLLQQAGLTGFGGDPAETSPTTVAETSAETPVEPSAEPVDGLEPKILDRLPTDGSEVATPVAPDARTVQTERVVPPAETPADTAPEPPVAQAPADAAPATAPAAGSPPAAAPSVEQQQGVAVAQKAILYEEPIPGSDGARIEGQVIWTYVNEPILPGEPATPQIRATVRIPDRNISLSLSIRNNVDAALPASHIVELAFALPTDFSGRFIETTPGLILKQSEDARGDPLIGAVAKVADNLFWLALSGTEQDTPRNIALLKEREWVDVPIRYGNRRRAILTFEKGTPGQRVFEQAFQAWGQ